MTEKELKYFIGNEVEDFFDAITADVTELAKYEALFNTKSSREYYLGIVNKLYSFLIKQCRNSLINYYQNEIKNIFPEKIETLPKNENITKTVKIEKTWEPVGETEES